MRIMLKILYSVLQLAHITVLGLDKYKLAAASWFHILWIWKFLTKKETYSDRIDKIYSQLGTFETLEVKLTQLNSN